MLLVCPCTSRFWDPRDFVNKDTGIGMSPEELATNLVGIFFSQSIKSKTDVLSSRVPSLNRVHLTTSLEQKEAMGPLREI